MMASPSELSFDCKPQIYSMLPKSFGDQASEHTKKLEEFVARLEEEKLKIDAFKRELPLCMQLLTNAMEASKQQLQSERASQGGRPVLEEFIPLKNMNASSKVEMSNEGNISADKANWMTSAQLWNQESEGGAKAPQSPLTSSPQESDIKLGLNNSKLQRINGGGAFLPFSSKDRGSSPSGEGYPELALSSSHKEEMAEEKRNSSEMKRESAGKSDEKEQGCGTAAANGGQAHRKARRCWSPDLHRRFVNALHMLGGSQVATPKQIRELMKVDGLTNDEVKSHLQKYRLHTRRPSPSPQSAVTAAPQVVVLGGIWVPPEYAAAAAAHGGAQAAALYGSAHPHHHVSSSSPFCSTNPAVAQDMYPAIAPPPNHQLQYHHQQLHLYSKSPMTQRNSSPESDIRGGAGDPSESIEDGKSESGSWKADSGGDHSEERRRVEGEESNASVVSLKF